MLYVEKSKKCKEKQRSLEDRKRPSVCGEFGDYCVTSQLEAHYFVVNKAAMDGHSSQNDRESTPS